MAPEGCAGAQPPFVVADREVERRDDSDLVRGFLRDCPTWTDTRSTQGRLAQGQLTTEDGRARRTWAVAASPADWPPPADETSVSKRDGMRHEQGRDALMHAWGATVRRSAPHRIVCVEQLTSRALRFFLRR